MPLDDRLTRLAPYVLSIVRIMVALLFFSHGLSKMTGFPDPEMPEAFTLSWWSGVIEFVGGALLAVGLFSRVSAFLMSGMMAVGYFLAHAPKSFFPQINEGDAAILYCFVFFYFVFAGPGPWSLDAMIGRGGGSRREGSIGRTGAGRI
jgi:putative oxidoreductase